MSVSVSEVPTHSAAQLQPPPEFLTREEVRALLRLGSVKLVDRLAKDEGLPKIKLHRKCTLYSRAAVLDWIREHQVTGNPLPAAPKRRRGRPRKPVQR
jgi:hypothetical protein